MSGPYNLDYLVPELRVPLTVPYEGAEFSYVEVDDWVDDRYPIINAAMRNPFTGEVCFSDNSSIVTFIYVNSEELRKTPGLENFPQYSISGSELEDRTDHSMFEVADDGTVTFVFDRRIESDKWRDPHDLARMANTAVARLLDGDKRLIDLLCGDVESMGGSLDLQEFVQPGAELAEDERYVEAQESPTLEDRQVALIAAGGFKAIALEAETLAEQGAERVVRLDLTDGLCVSHPPGVLPPNRHGSDVRLRRKMLTPPRSSSGKSGFFAKLFGRS